MLAKIISIANPQPSPLPNIAPINCYHSKHVRRRERTLNYLLPEMNALGLDCSLFDAVTDKDFQYNSGSLVYANKKYLVVNGSLGCTLSHAMLWELCVSLDQPLMIFEDDALLPPEHRSTVINAIREWEIIPDDSTILYLQTEIPWQRNGKHNYSDNMLSGYSPLLRRVGATNDLSGAAAYCVKPKSAASLLQHMDAIYAVDNYIHTQFRAGHIGVVVPADFMHMFMLFEVWELWQHEHSPAKEIK